MKRKIFNQFITFLQSLEIFLFNIFDASDTKIKNHPFIQPIYFKFFSTIILYFGFSSIKITTFYTIFDILPRILLLYVFISILIYDKLHYSYFLIFLIFIIILRKYFIFSLNKYKLQRIAEFNEYVSYIYTPYAYGLYKAYHPEILDPEDEDDDDEGYVEGTSMPLPIDRFIRYCIVEFVYSNDIVKYTYFGFQDSIYIPLYKKYNVNRKIDLTYKVYNSLEKVYTIRAEKDIKEILLLSVFIYYYDIILSNPIYTHIKDILKKLKEFSINLLPSFKFYFILLFGLGVITFYLWLYFFRERLSRELPLNLNLLSFLVLIYICFIYIWVIKILLYPTFNSIALTITTHIYNIFNDFDNTLKQIPTIQLLYLRFFSFVIPCLNFFIIKTSIFHIVFDILPRIVLLSILIVDVFYFHKLQYFYTFVFISSIFFFRLYFIFSLKKYLSQLITILQEDISYIYIPYSYGIREKYWPELIDPEDEKDDGEEYGCMMVLPIERFIQYYIDEYFNNNNLTYETGPYKTEFYEKICIKHNLKNESDITFDIRQIYRDKTENQIKEILELAVLLEYYKRTEVENIYKKIKIAVIILFLITWIYVIIISIIPQPLSFIIFMIYEYIRDFRRH